MILSFFTQKSTRSAKLSSVFAERFSGEGQADFAINKAHKVSLKGRNNLYISCVFNGFKYRLWVLVRSVSPQSMFWSENKKNRYTPAYMYPSFAL